MDVALQHRPPEGNDHQRFYATGGVDQHSHTVGDSVLRTVAHLLTDTARSDTLLACYMREGISAGDPGDRPYSAPRPARAMPRRAREP
ncbi:hypothetical protein DEDE109153_10065 [Deinococcus deserti]